MNRNKLLAINVLILLLIPAISLAQDAGGVPALTDGVAAVTEQAQTLITSVAGVAIIGATGLILAGRGSILMFVIIAIAAAVARNADSIAGVIAP